MWGLSETNDCELSINMVGWLFIAYICQFYQHCGFTQLITVVDYLLLWFSWLNTNIYCNQDCGRVWRLYNPTVDTRIVLVLLLLLPILQVLKNTCNTSSTLYVCHTCATPMNFETKWNGDFCLTEIFLIVARLRWLHTFIFYDFFIFNFPQ